MEERTRKTSGGGDPEWEGGHRGREFSLGSLSNPRTHKSPRPGLDSSSLRVGKGKWGRISVPFTGVQSLRPTR